MWTRTTAHRLLAADDRNREIGAVNLTAAESAKRSLRLFVNEADSGELAVRRQELARYAVSSRHQDWCAMTAVTGDFAGRSYGRVYNVSRKSALRDFLCDAVGASGGTVLYVSLHTRAPIFVGIQANDGERLGVLCYLFTANQRPTRNRPADEARLQIKYGDVARAREQDVSTPARSNPSGLSRHQIDLLNSALSQTAHCSELTSILI